MRRYTMWVMLLLFLSSLAACGQARDLAAPTVAPLPITRPTAHIAPTVTLTGVLTPTPLAIAPTAAPQPTFLPEQRVSIVLNGRAWHLPQPVGVAPLIAQGNAGILWLAFPYAKVVAPPEGDGIPRPLDAYFVMYTPLTEPGDDLDAGGYRIAPLWSETDDATRSLVALTPLEHNRFLLVSRRLCQGCQNGGTLEFWRIDPAHYGQPESFVSILELPGEGGGHFLTFAISPRWLLWSAVDLPDLDPVAPARQGEVGLLDFESGRRHIIPIEEPYGAEQAEWGADGRFHQYLLDPSNQHITRAAGS